MNKITSTYLPIITLNVSGPSSPIKRYRVTAWIKDKNHKTQLQASCKRLTSEVSTHRLKVKGRRKTFHANENKKEARIAVLISGKIGFKDYKKRQRRALHSDKGAQSNKKL